jgi:L,D-transpeptidase YcbB
MPGARLDQFLASTAVALLLAAVPIGATAQSPADSGAAPGATNDAFPASSGDDRAAPPRGKSADPTANTAATPPTASAPAMSYAPAAEGAVSTMPPSVTATAPDNSPPASTATVAPAAAPLAAEPPASPPPAAAATPPTATPQPDQTAAKPDAASPAASALNPADAAVADQLRNLASGKFDRTIGSKKDRVVIDAFYSGRDYAPIWVTDGKANDRARAAMDYLKHVDADGLDPSDYPLPDFAAASDPSALADAELKLSMSLITYAHHASVGRVHWSRVSADILYTDKPPEPADVLAKMVEAKDTAAALDTYEPHTPQYLALKAKLAEIRAGKVDPTKPMIPSGPAPKIGGQDDRVPDLRERLGVTGDGTTYDKALADAVRKFQQQHDIKATGTLTAATIEALNGRQPDRPTDIIIANMERWRWLPHDLGTDYVLVNLPDFSLRVFHDGRQIWQTRIVIGKPDMPTPIMSAEMKYITINPTWNVPPSIVNREYLPALQQDPTVMERMGLKVGHNPDGTVHIWQPPGDKNALGRIRFNFPNKFLVYQHDTPDKYLFANDKRAFSHGCMRVQDPQRYAEVLLSMVRPNDGYSIDRIKRMIGTNEETDIQFPTFIPVNLTYQTAFVDDDGKLQFRDDVYGRDRTLLALLKGSDRQVADIPIEHKEDITHRQVLAIPDSPSLWGGGGGRGYYTGSNYGAGSEGGGFFSRLFGSFAAAPPPAPVPVHHRSVQRRKETNAGAPVQR